MKKFKLVMFAAISIFVLGACGSSEDLTDYAFASFTGLDSQGEANYGVDLDSLTSELFSGKETDENSQEEMSKIASSFDITLDKEDELSNGDKVVATITVDKDKSKAVVGGEKEFTVEGLEEPIKVTTEEIEKGLVVNFLGVSGQGVAQIDSTLSSPLSNIEFSIENDGELENGDKAKFILSEDAESHLQQEGYILEEGFNPTIEVKDLGVVAEKAEDIKNLKDIKRMIDEEIDRKYENSDLAFSFRTYETKKNDLMYRQFEDIDSDDDSDNYYGDNDKNNNGNLIGIYSIKQFNDKEKTDLDSEYTAIVGFTNIILDEDNKTNVSKIEVFSEEKDDTYSLESIIQLYEGNGYTKVKSKED